MPISDKSSTYQMPSSLKDPAEQAGYISFLRGGHRCEDTDDPHYIKKWNRGWSTAWCDTKEAAVAAQDAEALRILSGWNIVRIRAKENQLRLRVGVKAP